MPVLAIHSVTCHETSDGLGADDLFINFRGERVFGVQEIDSGQTINPGVQAFFFNERRSRLLGARQRL